MKIVQHVLITTNRIHIRIDSTAGIETVALESKALPFGKRMHNLRFGFRMQDFKRNRPLITVQIVIQARIIRYKQRCRNTV